MFYRYPVELERLVEYMARHGYSVRAISEYTGLSYKEIQEILMRRLPA